MASRTIKVPDIGEGIAEVELVAWRVKPGDRVAEDQIIAEVMTDKAAVEVPSPVAGTVSALGGEVGQMLAVGSELIRIELGDGAQAPATIATPAAAAAAQSLAAPSAIAPTPPAPSTFAAAPARPMATVAPQAQMPQMPQVPQVPQGPAVAAAIAPADAAAVPVRSAKAPGTDRPIASPSVRRRAWELGVDLGAVVPTGPAGRVTHADVEAHAASHPAAPAPASARPSVQTAAIPAPARTASPVAQTTPVHAVPRASAEPAPPRAATPAAPAEHPGEERIPVIGLRRRIAVKMQESKRRIPHYSYVEEVDVTEVEALRAQLNAKWADQRPRLTLLPLIARAIVLAVREHPVVNARFDDEAGIITRYAAVHLGIATQTPSGLLVPVLTHAQTRDLWSTASEVARLAEVARAGRATRAELSGSTLTITSLGPLGGIATTPVINHPEVAIVGVNRIVERPMLRSGLVVARQLMNLSSSFDHRVVDGIDAARFIQSVRAYLESPATMFVA